MDGGSGIDTLRLDFTLAEWLDAATQRDVGRYATFLDSGRAGWETFRGFGLTIQGVEKASALVDGKFQDLADAKVTANADAWTITESGKASGNVTLNDVVPDLIREVKLLGTAPQGLAFKADGSFTFETGGRFEYLAVGETAKVSFDYQVIDADGDKATAKATITITGQNDKPVLSLGAGDSDAAALVETNAGLVAQGSLTLTDLDLSDVVGASVASVAVSPRG
jgi:VCBS repeat-containing protein